MGAKRPPLKIQEIDGSPGGYPTVLKVTNATLTDNGDGSYTLTIGTGSSVTVIEEDGSPSVAATTIKVPNGSMVDDGGGVIHLRDIPSGFIGASAYHNTTQSVTTATYTALSLNSERFDTDGFHDTGSNTSRMTIPTGLGGKYLVRGQAAYSGNSTGARYLKVFKNNATNLQIAVTESNPDASDFSLLNLSGVVDLVAGDYVELLAYQDSGGSLTVGAATDYYSTAFEIVKLDGGKIGAGVGAKAIRSADQTGIVTATFTSMLWTGTDTFDTDGFHDPASNSNRMTIPAGLGGKYILVANIEWDSNGTGERIVSIQDSGGTAVGWARDLVSSSGNHGSNVTAIVDAAAGAWYEVQVYQASGGNRSVLAARSSFSIMRIDALPAKSAFRGCRIYNNSTKNISNSTATAVTFDSERFDTDAFHDTGSNTSRITIPAGLAGKYLVGGSIEWPSTAGGSVREAYIRVNGSTIYAVTGRQGTYGSEFVYHTLETLVDLAAGDYVELIVTQSSGGTLTLAVSTGYQQEFWASLQGN